MYDEGFFCYYKLIIQVRHFYNCFRAMLWLIQCILWTDHKILDYFSSLEQRAYTTETNAVYDNVQTSSEIISTSLRLCLRITQT